MKKLIAAGVVLAGIAGAGTAKADHMLYAQASTGGFYLQTAGGNWCLYRDTDPTTTGNRIFLNAVTGVVNPNLVVYFYNASQAGWGYGTDGGNTCAELSLLGSQQGP